MGSKTPWNSSSTNTELSNIFIHPSLTTLIPDCSGSYHPRVFVNNIITSVGFETLHGRECNRARFVVGPCVNLLWVVLVLRRTGGCNSTYQSRQPDSYLLWMRICSKFWRLMAVFAPNVTQKLNTVQLMRIFLCEFVISKFVSHSQFTGSMNRALSSNQQQRPASSWRRSEHTDRNLELSTTGSSQNQHYSWCYQKQTWSSHPLSYDVIIEW